MSVTISIGGCSRTPYSRTTTAKLRPAYLLIPREKLYALAIGENLSDETLAIRFGTFAGDILDARKKYNIRRKGERFGDPKKRKREFYQIINRGRQGRMAVDGSRPG